MPFASQAQQRFAFGTHQPWAKRWAKQTDFSTLPKRAKRKTLKAAPCMDCVLASLKGEQIAPGITRIRGNLCNVHGRYGLCPGATPSKGRKPKGRAARKPRKPVQTPEQRAQARAAQQQTNRTQVMHQLGLAEDATGALDDLRAGKPVTDDGGLVKMGLAEQAADGSYRLTPSGRALVNAANSGDAGRARDIMSSAHDRKGAQTERQQASAARHAAAEQRRADAEKKRAAAAKKKPKGGGGGGKGSSTSDATTAREAARNQAEQQRQQDRAQRQQEHAADRAQRQAEHAADRAQRQREHEQDRQQRQQDRMANRRTPALQPVRATRPPIVSRGTANRGTRRKAADPGDYLVVEDRTKPSTWHLQVKRNGKIDHGLMGSAWAALHAGFRGNTYSGPNKGEALAKLKKLYASEGMDLPSEKSFAVFKDATGAWRWLSRTTTAFEDRDSEVISTKALEDSAGSAAPRGPLRFWHMGRPDPLSPDRPWGPGVDLGWCDFAAIHGKTLIESGTFKSDTIARAVAAKADQLELSPGFFHAAGEPDASGVFNHIRIFERSLVPKWAGRASNPYTGLVVEKAMDQKKIDALQTLGVPEATIKELLAEVATTEKAAEADGVRYKDEKAISIVERFKAFLSAEQPATKAEEPPAVATEPEPAPDPIADLMATVKALQEEVATLKAGGMGGMMDAEDDPAMGGDMGVDEAAEGEPPIDQTGDGGDGGLTLSADDLGAIGQVIGQVLTAALEPLVGALGITQKLDGHLGELKSMLAGYSKTKDDERAQLAARLDQTEAKLDELTGDAPRNAGYRASQANDNTAAMLLEALKESPNGANAGSNHPFADQTAQWFPNIANPQ